MAINYTLNILKLKVLEHYNGLNDIVSEVVFEYKGTNENNISFALENTMEFLEADSSNYIEYNNLTKQDIDNWIKSRFDVTTMNKTIETEILKKSRPALVEKQLPWSN